MHEKTAQKPIFLAMEDAQVASPIIQYIRCYPNLEMLRVAKPPGKLAVFMIEREPSTIFVDMGVGPDLVAKAKSRVPDLNVIVVAPSNDVLNVPVEMRLRTRFVSEDCKQREIHALLDTLLDDARDDIPPAPVADMIAFFSIGNLSGVLNIRNNLNGDTGYINIAHNSIGSSHCGNRNGLDAVDYMKRWNDCSFQWEQSLAGIDDDSFLEEISNSMIANPSGLVSNGHGLIEATDTSMFPMAFASGDDDDDSNNSFFDSNLLNSSRPNTTGAEHSLNQHPDSLKSSVNHENVDNKLSSKTDAFVKEVKPPSQNTKLHPGDDSNIVSSSKTEEHHSGASSKHPTIGDPMSSNASEVLQELTTIAGFIAGAVVDSDSGMTLAKISNSMSFDIDVAAATNTEVIKAKLRAAKALKLDGALEDILITLTNQYHLLRPLDEYPSIFFYIALDREQANLAMARIKLKTVGSKIKL